MVAEMRINKQSSELKDANRARNEEVAQLRAEVSRLECQLRQPPKLACMDPEPEGEPSARRKDLEELRTQLEMELVKSSVAIEKLHKQLVDQRSQIEQARQQSFQAIREKAEHQVRIVVERQRNMLETAALKRRLMGDLASDTREASVCERRTVSSRETNELQEVEAALASERIAQQKERALLEQELRAQHEKATSELADPYRIDDELSKQCVNLQKQASDLLRCLGGDGHLPVPPEIDDIQDLTAHSVWLRAFADRCEMLVHRTASASKT